MKSLDNTIVIIPALNPDERLVTLIKQLIDLKLRYFIIVDDGSDEEHLSVFRQIEQIPECKVLTHANNLGKGCALKTAFGYFLDNYPEHYEVVTTEADGQHAPEAILEVAGKADPDARRIILGSRTFDKNRPWKSRLGNALAYYAFRFFVGEGIRDARTGLRNIPGKLIPTLMKIPGKGPDYELNVLIRTKQHNIEIEEVPIQTVFAGNSRPASLHPIYDLLRISLVFVRFLGSSLTAAACDLLVFCVVFQISQSILYSLVLARLISSIVNFSVNRTLVFSGTNKLAVSILSYYLLLIVVAASAYVIINGLHTYLGWNIILAKITAETVLFVISFRVQRDLVFRPARQSP